jgi:hypothetical protein
MNQHRNETQPELEQFPSELSAHQAEELRGLAAELSHQEMVPSAATRSRIEQLVLQVNPRSRPAQLRLLVASYVISGAVLLLVGTLAALGGGPLGV